MDSLVFFFYHNLRPTDRFIAVSGKQIAAAGLDNLNSVSGLLKSADKAWRAAWNSSSGTSPRTSLILSGVNGSWEQENENFWMAFKLIIHDLVHEAGDEFYLFLTRLWSMQNSSWTATTRWFLTSTSRQKKRNQRFNLEAAPERKIIKKIHGAVFSQVISYFFKLFFNWNIFSL